MPIPQFSGAPRCTAAVVTQVDFSCDNPYESQQYEGFVCGECFQATEPLPILQADVVVDGCATPMTAYCINICADTYPEPCEKYVTGEIAAASPALSPQQARQVQWLLSNGYPAMGADKFFAAAGVDPEKAPMLNDLDASAVMQLVIWGIQAQPNPQFNFYQCGTKHQHAKGERMAKAAAYWYRKALENYDHPLPYLCFAKTKPALVCGSDGTAIIGPFQIDGCGQDVDAARLEVTLNPYVPAQYVADTMGTAMPAVSLGQPFYLKFPPGTRNIARLYSLCASIIGSYGHAFGLAPLRMQQMPQLQPLGTVLTVTNDVVFRDAVHFQA